jgi:hypothetical protein
MFQLRLYTLRSAEALKQYATIHWARHIPTFQGFGVTTHGIWTERGCNAHRLVALISYPNDADPTELASEVMASPKFAADMEALIPKTSLPSTPSPWMRPDPHLSSDRTGWRQRCGSAVGDGAVPSKFADPNIARSQALAPVDRETLLQTIYKAIDHRHTDGAHHRHEQSGSSSASMTNRLAMVVIWSDAQHGHGEHCYLWGCVL